jgi:F0F1-type ATP synthase epsilon subunit
LKSCKVVKEIQIEMTEIIIEHFEKHNNIVVNIGFVEVVILSDR